MSKQQPQQQRSSENPLSDGPPPKRARKVYAFDIPVDLQEWEDGRKVIGLGLYKLDTDEELAVLALAGDDGNKRGIEYIKACMADLVLDGGHVKRMSVGDGTADSAMKQMPPPLRALLGMAVTNMHAPTEAQTDGFFASQRVVVR